jgi:hypothetical protein
LQLLNSSSSAYFALSAMPMEWVQGVFLPFTLLAMSCKAYIEGTFLLLLSAGD